MTIHGEVQRIIAGGVDGSEVGEEPGMAIRFVYREGDPQDQIAQSVEALMSDSLGPRLYAKLLEQAQKRER